MVLALGFGATTAVFSIVNEILLRPLAVKNPSELAFVYEANTGFRTVCNYAEYEEFAAHEDLFSGVTAFFGDSTDLRLGQDVERLAGEQVPANYFAVLDVRPILGRVFGASDTAPQSPMVVISETLWRRRFDADRNVIGATLNVGLSRRSRPSTIIGVVPSAFRGLVSPWRPTEYWTLIQQRGDDLGSTNRTPAFDALIARRRNGVSMEQVQVLASSWGRSLARTRRIGDVNTGKLVLNARRFELPFTEHRAIIPSRLGAGLMLVAGLVLAVAVSNLLGVILSRGVTRQREAALRMTLGASRWRVTRQFIVEGVLLATAGGAIGLLLSSWFAKSVLDSMSAVNVSSATGVSTGSIPVDWRVLGFGVLVWFITGLALGLAPMRQACNVNLLDALANVSVIAPGGVRLGLRRWIAIPQAALSVALLLTALVAVSALLRTALVDSGYEPERAVTVELDLPLVPNSTDPDGFYEWRDSVLRRVLEIAAASPSIEFVALTDATPIQPRKVPIVSRESGEQISPKVVAVAHVTPEYFRALGIPVVLGRPFGTSDVLNAQKVAIVDRQLADQLWPGRNPVGQYLAPVIIGGGASPAVDVRQPEWLQVVGVAGSVRSPLSEGDVTGFLYSPLAQLWAHPHADTIVARARGSDAETLRVLREIIAQIDSNIGIVRSTTLLTEVNRMRYPRRLAATLFGFLGLVGLLLAGVGVYGVISYSVAQRLKELGVRAALGAGRRDLIRLVMREGAQIAVAGIVLGLLVGYAGIRVAANYVVPVQAVSLMTFVTAPLVVVLVILLACYIPARRAGTVDPLSVLRVP